jgi:DNA repair exonuclease SbcCD ATPase subunit
MKIKHKLLSDYQYVSPDKKIFLIKSGTVVEEYCYKLKGELIPLDKDIIEMNPQIFELIDWKAELMSFMKVNKMPQPAQLGKKLIPFFEEMILSSIQQNNNSTDISSVREIEKRESELNSIKRDLDRRDSDLDSRERRIKDKEDDVDVRLKRVEKRENDYKEDLKSLDKKEDELRARHRELTNKELDVQDKIQDLNDKERNLDRSLLTSAKEFDSKYAELQSKIDEDMRIVNDKERKLEILSKELKSKESDLIQREAEIEDRLRNLEQRIEDLNSEESSLMRLQNELDEKQRFLVDLENSLRPPAPTGVTMPR